MFEGRGGDKEWVVRKAQLRGKRHRAVKELVRAPLRSWALLCEKRGVRGPGEEPLRPVGRRAVLWRSVQDRICPLQWVLSRVCFHLAPPLPLCSHQQVTLVPAPLPWQGAHTVLLLFSQFSSHGREV